MTEVNTTSSSPLVGAMGKIKESAMHIFGQVRYDPPPPTIEASPRRRIRWPNHFHEFLHPTTRLTPASITPSPTTHYYLPEETHD